MSEPGRLDADYRTQSWDRLRAGVDVLVVGGGVTGCGIALDAALRGLSVGLVEQRDFAAGTSSRSSKLVHGGLRYLEQFNFTLVREALRERALLLDHLAPHLVTPLPFLYPLAHRIWERPYVGAGLTLYDTLGGLVPSLPRHSHLSKSAALRAFPSLREETLAGAIRYHDAQVDDARHTLELARTAAAHGASLVAGARVVGFAREGERVVGAQVLDATTGQSHDVPATVVVNATGVWAGITEQLAGVEQPIRMRPSKGVHIVVPGDRIDASVALITRTRTSVLFVLPWGRSWVIGTTDTTWHHGLSHPSATHADISYLLEQANAALTSGLTEDDVIGLYAGLRPLVDTEGLAESEISREHTVRSPLRGLVTITGGKYTTYRVMAEDAVDACGEDLFPGRPDLLPPSRSAEVPLLGACEPETLLAELAGWPGTENIDAAHLDRLAHRYGRLLPELLLHVDEEPELAREVPGGAGTLAVEIVHAASHEGALHIEDVLTRRTRLYLEAGDRGLGAAPHAARLMGDVLGWDDATREREVARYRQRVEAELEAQAAPDDDAAAAIRERVTDPRVPG
ncbi:MAG: FAD-dependent oxidoreductase [Frankiales bacterium]|nr:FAD-dependent oxidoreductase [Frankiales bacterium]